jgi:hypothetical protein
MRTRGLAFVIAFSCAAVAGAAACGGNTSASTASETDGGGTDGGGPDAGEGDAGLFPADVSKVVVKALGGGPLPPPPDGSTCTPTNATYTFVLPARTLSWSFCDWGDGGPYVLRTGEKNLTEAEYASFEAIMRKITRTTKTQCGFDKPTETITFTTPSGDVTYYDDFYFCDANDPKIYVSGIDDLLYALYQYAR